MRLFIDDGQLCLSYIDRPDYKEWLYLSIGVPMDGYRFMFARCYRYDGLCKGCLLLGWVGIWWGADYEHIDK